MAEIVSAISTVFIPMKKILYVTTISGFLPQFELNDVKIIQEMGYEVHYASNFDNPIYTFDEKELTEKGIVLHHIDVMKSPLCINENIRAVKQLRNIIDTESINLIHCHNPMGAMTARYAAHTSKQKPLVIYTAHGFHFYSGAPKLNWLLYYPAEKVAAHWTDAIIAINEEDYKRAQKEFRLKSEGFVEQIHGVGIDKNRFSPKPEIGKLKRKEMGIPADAFHIVTAAELNDNKNQRVIIEALSMIKRDDVYYSICGKGPDKEKLEELIEKYKLSDRVRLLGYRTDMDEVLQTADVFAFPSKREGLGIAAVEALSCGVPLIASDNRGTREYAVHNMNAIVCKSDSVTDFVKAIDKVSTNTKFLQMLRTNSRRSAMRFSMEETEKIMRSVYERIDRKVLSGL